MSHGLKQKPHLADKLPQLPGYLCTYRKISFARKEKETRYLREYSQQSAPLLFSPSLSFALSPSSLPLSCHPTPSVPCGTVGAFLCAANRAVFLYLFPQKGKKREGVMKEEGLCGRVSECACRRVCRLSSLVINPKRVQL